MHATESILLHPSIVLGADHDTPRGCHLNFLTEKDAPVNRGKQYIASRRMGDLHVIEVKGIFETDWSFDLFPLSCFWLHFQFIGRSQRGDKIHTALSNSAYQGFYSGQHPSQIRVKGGKAAMVLIGIEMDDTASFTSEWPLLAEPKTVDQPYFSSIPIGYRIKQVFEKIGQYTDSRFSLYRKIYYHLCQLIEVYHQDLDDKRRAQHKEDIVIYHEAIEYITEHYMSEDINRDTIAKHLGIGVRKLYRVFEDKHITIHGAIQTIRLHKARELLRETDDSVDIIAFQLNFSTAHYFYKQYVQRFGHSPSKERELYLRSKKKKKRKLIK